MASDLSIQRGQADIGTAGGTAAPATTFGDLSSVVVFSANNRMSHGGPPSSGSNMEGDDMSGGVRLTAVDTIAFTRQPASNAAAMRFAWESWEYVGNPGGAYEFIVRSRNTVALSGTSGTATLDSTPTDIDRCIPFITGNSTSDGSDDWDAACSIAWLSGANTLNVARGGTTGTTTVEVTTVEFTGSAWDVKHGRVESPADSGTITLVDAADGETAGGGDVGDWANALIFGYFRGNNLNGVDDAISDTSAVYDPGANTTTVAWQFNGNHADAGTAQDGQHFVHVLACADMAVTRINNTGNGAGANNVDISAAGLSALGESGCVVRRHSSGGGTAYGRGWVNWRLTSTTNCELWVHRSGNTIRTVIQTADFAGMVDAGSTDIFITPATSSTSSLSASTTLTVATSPTFGASSTSASSVELDIPTDFSVDVQSTFSSSVNVDSAILLSPLFGSQSGIVAAVTLELGIGAQSNFTSTTAVEVELGIDSAPSSNAQAALSCSLGVNVFTSLPLTAISEVLAGVEIGQAVTRGRAIAYLTGYIPSRAVGVFEFATTELSISVASSRGLIHNATVS